MIAPPSTHTSGRQYKLLADNLAILSKDQVRELFYALDSLSESNTFEAHSLSRDKEILLELSIIRTQRIAELVRSCYLKGNRDEIIFALSGYLHRRLVSKQSALAVVKQLVDDDEEKSSRLKVVENTYKRHRDSIEVSGYKRLLEALTAAFGGSATDANEVLSEINTIIKESAIEQNLNLFDYIQGRQHTFSSIEDQLSQSVIDELSRHRYKITCYNPLQLTIAHFDEKKIFHAQIDYIRNRQDKNGQDKDSPRQYLKLTDVIIDAVPKQVTIFDNPIDKNRKVQIQFKSKSTRDFIIGPGSISSILEELQNRNMLIKKAAATDALAAIIGAFERAGDAVINDSITTPGYYLVDGKLVANCVTQTNAESIETNDILQCIELLDELVNKYKNNRIFPSVLKWAVVAPFSFILKDYNDNWMPWLHLYGITSSGKSSLGLIALAVWRKHKNSERKDHQLGFNNIDSVARFGNAISKSTYPVLVNEVGALSNEKYYFMVEMIKHAVENQTARGKFVDGSYNHIPALSSFILTSNYSPPSDPAYRRRVLSIHFPREELHDQKEAEEFKKWLSERIDVLGVLGDFAAKYLIDNSDILKIKQWEDLAKIILTEFYKAGGIGGPKWLDNFIEHKSIEESSDETHFELRAFFMEIITNTYSRHIKALTPNQSQDIVLDVSFDSRLNFCLDNELIPFLHQHINKRKETEIAITADIFVELKKRKIQNITHLRDLASELGFEYCQRKLGGIQTKVICGERKKFIEFLEGNMEEEIRNERPSGQLEAWQ